MLCGQIARLQSRGDLLVDIRALRLRAQAQRRSNAHDTLLRLRGECRLFLNDSLHHGWREAGASRVRRSLGKLLVLPARRGILMGR